MTLLLHATLLLRSFNFPRAARGNLPGQLAVKVTPVGGPKGPLGFIAFSECEPNSGKSQNSQGILIWNSECKNKATFGSKNA